MHHLWTQCRQFWSPPIKWSCQTNRLVQNLAGELCTGLFSSAEQWALASFESVCLPKMSRDLNKNGRLLNLKNYFRIPTILFFTNTISPSTSNPLDHYPDSFPELFEETINIKHGGELWWGIISWVEFIVVPWENICCSKKLFSNLSLNTDTFFKWYLWILPSFQ